MKKLILFLSLLFFTPHLSAQNIFYLGVSLEKLFGLEEQGSFEENDVPIEFGNSNGFVYSVLVNYTLKENFLIESGLNLVNRKHDITLISTRGDLTDTRSYYNLEIPFNIGYRIPLVSHKGFYFIVYMGLSYRIKQVDEDFPRLEASDYNNIKETFRMMQKTVTFDHALFYSAKLGLQLPLNKRVILESGIKYTNSITECNSINFYYSNEGQTGTAANYFGKTNYITIYLKAILFLTKSKNEKL